MDVRMFIGACLLLATMASVSVSGEDATMNFCLETLRRFGEKWPKLFGEDYSKLDELNGIPDNKVAEYRKSIKDLPAKQEMCLDFTQLLSSVSKCVQSLESFSKMTDVQLQEALGMKALYVCERVYYAKDDDIDAPTTVAREPIRTFCNDTLSSLYRRWILKFEVNEFVIAVSAEYGKSWSAIPDYDWRDYIESDPDYLLEGARRMCLEFERMDEAAGYCKERTSNIPSSESGEKIRSICEDIIFA